VVVDNSNSQMYPCHGRMKQHPCPMPMPLFDEQVPKHEMYAHPTHSHPHHPPPPHKHPLHWPIPIQPTITTTTTTIIIPITISLPSHVDLKYLMIIWLCSMILLHHRVLDECPHNEEEEEVFVLEVHPVHQAPVLSHPIWMNQT